MLPSATLAEFYRFALLLTGQIESAERIMAETLAESERRLGEIRDVSQRAAGLAVRIRQRCLENQPAESKTPRLVREEENPDLVPEVLQIEAYILAQHFQALPEPERSALALFYLELVTPEQIARLLGMDLEQLAGTLGHARALLQDSLRGKHQGA